LRESREFVSAADVHRKRLKYLAVNIERRREGRGYAVTGISLV